MIWENNGERLYTWTPLSSNLHKKKWLRVLRFLLGMREKFSYNDADKMSVTVLIPAYNEVSSIGNTIRSIRKQTRRVDKILVVDDCSTDGTATLAKCLKADVVRTPKNTGTKAQAQNYALPYIRTTAVVTIDADTILAPDAIEKILPPLQDANVASSCGFVIPQRIRTIWERARYIQYLWGISVIKESQSSIGSCLVSSGCFSAYRVATLRRLDGFPQRTMVEDMDLTWTHLEEGRKVVVVPDARCYPIDPHNYATYRAQVERWLRGFLQVISIHKLDILKRKSLAFFVLWSLIDGLTSPLVFWALLLSLRHPDVGGLLLLTNIIGMIIVSIVTVLEANKEKRAWLAIKSLPAYFIITPINAYLFWKSVFLEWIVRRRLTEWNKGH